jgi:hypothetical protein
MLKTRVYRCALTLIPKGWPAVRSEDIYFEGENARDLALAEAEKYRSRCDKITVQTNEVLV